ncbi:exo-beta-N-acetylmuramidase NamZ domain-containing protein [Gracilimonas sediminicola]|uniref:exo-beta-N-acetylmuramidase NamZ family protein n=2 Tax=Gracilimonas TaxID=649462 RepID=UPI0038D46696
MMMKKALLVLLVSFLGYSNGFTQHTNQVKTGIEVLAENNFELLKGKRVGVITNATGVNADLVSTVDLIYNAPGVELTALYGPEHGVRGEFAAGDKVDTYVDEATGVTVFSLYGATRKPTPEMLENVDVLVYDIQDIGVRSYTYISTMGLAMEAAAEHDLEFVVLDRPNPLGGEKVEGNIVEEGYFSFVSQFPVPYIYGLTPGEVAKMINKEGWLANGKQCNLTVVEMEGWNRSMTFDETGLPWVPTSPHIPHEYSAYFYVATGIMGELGVFSEGVGYTLPFQVFAAEWIDEGELADRMNALDIPGVVFRPIVFKPFYGRDQGKTLHGVQIHFSDYTQAHLMKLQFWFMQVHKEMYPDKDVFEMGKNRWSMFEKVTGTDQIRKRFSQNYKVSDISEYLSKDIASFKEKSQNYYLYK